MWPFPWFHFLNVWYGKTAPVRADCRYSRGGYCWFFWMWKDMLVWIYWHSHTAIMMTLKLTPMSLFQTDFYHQTTLQLKLRTDTLTFFPSFNVFETMHTSSAKIIVCWRVASCDSGPESESAKFYLLQLRIQLRPKRSTQIDPNSGLNFDSAAVLRSAIAHNVSP